MEYNFIDEEIIRIIKKIKRQDYKTGVFFEKNIIFSKEGIKYCKPIKPRGKYKKI